MEQQTPHTDEEWRELVLGVAKKVLSPTQYTAYVECIVGQRSPVDLATELRCSKQAVTYALWGHRRGKTAEEKLSHPTGGGAVAAVANALMRRTPATPATPRAARTPAVAAIPVTAATPATPATPRLPVLGHFASATTQDVPGLLVQLLASHLADARGQCTVDDLRAELPHQVIAHGLQWCRLHGKLQLSGQTVTITTGAQDG